MSKKQTRRTQKENKNFVKRIEKGQTCKTNIQICENVPKRKRYLKHAEVSGRVFETKAKKGDKTLLDKRKILPKRKLQLFLKKKTLRIKGKHFQKKTLKH